ncbi:hypothetical protein DW150_17670 [Phocaeicola vulgatus]|uniref:Uncharacterized protein n=1 Tax=Phocaeicola vulgatus TaxID=821 RepID=A0A415BL31_PHOVU|nr:hypothetical protein DW150_17670 [Phocaeicola vulgatus]
MGPTLFLCRNTPDLFILYPQLCCVVYWLNSIVLENTFITDFKQLLISHPSVKTRLLGFPRNWEQEPLWR